MKVKIVMGNQYLSVMCNILEVLNILTRTIYLMLVKNSDDKVNESDSEGSEKSNNGSSPAVHVDIS